MFHLKEANSEAHPPAAKSLLGKPKTRVEFINKQIYLYWEHMLFFFFFFTVRGVQSKTWETTALQLLVILFSHAAWSQSLS